uniref:TRAF3 interacting protein 3 n=1 Tax=Nannospalax galili TaxID=1026970 RepID=A0A8C6W1T0_NANGA
MKKVLLEMEDQKNSYEQKAKESLQKVLEEKMSAEQQLHSAQLSLALAEKKCEEWRSQYEALKEDWKTLGAQHRELESQLHVLQSKLQGADSRDSWMNQALRLLENEHQELQAKIEHLQGDRDQQSSNTQDLQEAMWPVAPGTDGGDRYSTGSVPDQQRRPDDMSNLVTAQTANNSVKNSDFSTSQLGFSLKVNQIPGFIFFTLL